MYKKIFALIAIFLIILIAGCVEKPYEKYFAGQTLHFRADLREAAKVPVYPNETALIDALYNPYTRRITIAHIPNETELPAYYVAAGFELAYKITIVYKYYEGEWELISQEKKENWSETCAKFNLTRRTLCIEVIVLNDTNIVAYDVNPVILLLGPSKANQTAVTVDDYLVKVEGKSFEETDRKYTDLDLAVDKLLLVLMNMT